jgi:hypothetical protein
MVSRAFTQEPFLTYEHETTILIAILLLYVPVRGPPLQNPYPLKRRN